MEFISSSSKIIRSVLIFTLLPWLCIRLSASEVIVDSVEALQEAVSKASPGDTIILSPGNYTKTMCLEGHGEAGAPIIIRSESLGAVTLNSAVLLRGAYLSLEGFEFGEWGRLEFTEGKGHRIFGSRFNALRAGHWVRFRPETTHCEVAYCSFTNDDNSNETRNQQLIQMLRSDELGPDYHHIHHNYFANITPGATSNGFETIQLYHGAEGGRGSSQTIVEYNVFEACNGETEMISVKCSDNIIRNNLIIESRGAIVVRKGTNNIVEGNVFLGNNVEGTAGIRFQGDGQVVINNFLYQLTFTAIALHNGDPENYYDPVTNAIIAFNTVVDCGRSLNVGIRHPKFDSSISPTGVVFANNILVTSNTQINDPDGALKNWTVYGNIAYGTKPEFGDSSGFTFVDPQLVTLPNQIQTPQAGSPAIGQAQGDFPNVGKDIFGDHRPAKGKTIGASELILPNLPVSRATVGPEAAQKSW